MPSDGFQGLPTFGDIVEVKLTQAELDAILKQCIDQLANSGITKDNPKYNESLQTCYKLRTDFALQAKRANLNLGRGNVPATNTGGNPQVVTSGGNPCPEFSLSNPLPAIQCYFLEIANFLLVNSAFIAIGLIGLAYALRVDKVASSGLGIVTDELTNKIPGSSIVKKAIKKRK